MEAQIITSEDLKKEEKNDLLDTEKTPNEVPQSSEEIKVVVPESDTGIEIISGDPTDVAPAAVETVSEELTPPEVPAVTTTPEAPVTPVEAVSGEVVKTETTTPIAPPTLPTHVLAQLQKLVDMELSQINPAFLGLGKYLDPSALSMNGDHVFIVPKTDLLNFLSSVVAKPETLVEELKNEAKPTLSSDEIKAREISKVLGLNY